MPQRQKNSGPREKLRLTLDAPATPERVCDLAVMFADTIREIRPDLAEGDVTMVVSNYDAVAEVRGQRGAGEIAVRLLGDLIDNSTDAVQTHAELASAARTLANHANRIVPYRPTFWRGKKKIRAVDDVFVRTMHAAGTEVLRRQASEANGPLTGDTIIYSPVLRVGRSQEGRRIQARVKLDGKFDDVDIADELVDALFEVAKTGQTCQLRVHGKWVEDADGMLRLRSARVVGLFRNYAPWSGKAILAAAHDASDVFSVDDFERMLDEFESTAAHPDG